MAETNDKLSPEAHAAFVQAYRDELRDHYDGYADILRRVLETCVKSAYPEALIQTRPKSLSSFAEKVIRKWKNYKKDGPLDSMTDLCGARVIVQTQEQVDAVRQFIRDYFDVEEEDDKSLALGEDKVGYRDLHFIVRLKGRGLRNLKPGQEQTALEADEDALDALCISPETAREVIGHRPAEIQVRTWVQHAWADAMHDRIYKSGIEASREQKRESSLLAATMEQGDRGFSALTRELDNAIANYSTTASREAVEQEIEIQEQLLELERQAAKEEEARGQAGTGHRLSASRLALRLAKLYAEQVNYGKAQAVLEANPPVSNSDQCIYKLKLGQSICRQYKPTGEHKAVYKDGCDLLHEAIDLAERKYVPYPRDPEHATSQKARAHNAYGHAQTAYNNNKCNLIAEEHFKTAYDLEPENPYYLRDLLELQQRIGARRAGSRSAMGATIKQAINRCRTHATKGLELPDAYFVAAHLALLLMERPTAEETGQHRKDKETSYQYWESQAMNFLALGIRHCRSGKYCICDNLFDQEIDRIEELWRGAAMPMPRHYETARDFLRLAAGRAKQIAEDAEDEESKMPAIAGPVLIVAGSAASISDDEADRLFKEPLKAGLANWQGTVISGGTNVGIPKLVGDITQELGDACTYTLAGYVPRRGEIQASDIHPAYKHHDGSYLIAKGEGFSGEQVLTYWRDILLNPSIDPAKVTLLGFAGGYISAIEYSMALALGGDVGVVTGIDCKANHVITDPLWQHHTRYCPMPLDTASIKAFLVKPSVEFEDDKLTRMAREFHNRYLKDSASKLPPPLRPWENLDETYVGANIEQARYAAAILAAAGFGIKEADDPKKVHVFADFTTDEVAIMAEHEHGRWNIERLRDGWRYGPAKDEEKKLHNCLLPWSDKRLDSVRHYDEESMKALPEILALIGYEVYRFSDAKE